MKVVTLMENTTCCDELFCEHGLSLYIETEGHRILFDAGQSAAFADNAEKLGVDLREVDFAVLSHGHYDHGGGLGRFLEIHKTAPVYVSRYAFEPIMASMGILDWISVCRLVSRSGMWQKKPFWQRALRFTS